MKAACENAKAYVVVNFVPKFVAMATGVGKEKILIYRPSLFVRIFAKH